MNKKTILFISYVDTDRIDSGSGVRPVKMLSEFIKTGHNIISLTGNQMDPRRKEAIKQIKDNIKTNKIDICYIESPVYPIMRHKDREIIKLLQKKGVPTGYFYRDFYRKFPKLFPRRKGIVNSLKELYLDCMQCLTDKVINYCDIVYLPSDRAKVLFKYQDMRALPPAGENRTDKYCYSRNIIYVGGISELYGFDGLIKGVERAYEKDRTTRLIVVCRENEWKKKRETYGKLPWLEVHHTSGEGLTPLYRKASVAILSKQKNEYNEMAVSVKLFEYIGYGLPVIATHSATTDKIIDEYKLGITVDDDPISIAEGIDEVLNNEDTYKTIREHVEKSLKESCLWSHRVRQVIEDLSEKTNKRHKYS